MIDHFLMERTQKLGIYLQKRDMSLPWILTQSTAGVIVLGTLYYLYFFQLIMTGWTGESWIYNLGMMAFLSITWLPTLKRRWTIYREYRSDSLNYDPVMVDKYYVKSSLNRTSHINQQVRWIFIGCSLFVFGGMGILFCAALYDASDWSSFGLFLALFLLGVSMLFQEYMECVPPVPPEKKKVREKSFEGVGVRT